MTFMQQLSQNKMPTKIFMPVIFVKETLERKKRRYWKMYANVEIRGLLAATVLAGRAESGLENQLEVHL